MRSNRTTKNPALSIVALIVAGLSIFVAPIPVCSLPVTLLALALGITGIFVSHRIMGIIATALAGLSLALALGILAYVAMNPTG